MYCGYTLKKRKERTTKQHNKAQSHRLTSEVLLNIVLVQMDVKSSRLSSSRFYHRKKKQEENELNQIVLCNNMQAK